VVVGIHQGMQVVPGTDLAELEMRHNQHLLD